MSTDAPTKPYASGKMPSPDKLRRMSREGRIVTREQKIRWQENREFYRGNQWVHQNLGQNQVRQLVRLGGGQPRVTGAADVAHPHHP